MTSILGATMDKQIEAANKLIHSEFENNVSRYNALFALTTVRPLGEFCRRFVWSKNHTQVAEGDTPTGFQLNVSPFAPIFSRPFHPTAMYNGILCFPLAAGLHTMTNRKTKKRVDLAHFTNNARLSEELKKIFEGEPCTDDDDNFAGIFYGNEGTETRFFVVVQANDPELSREAYRMVCESEPASMGMVRDCVEVRMLRGEAVRLIHDRRIEQHNTAALDEPDRLLTENIKRLQDQRKIDPDKPPYTTWKTLFSENPKMYEIEKKQEHYRASIACRILKAAGLGPPSEEASNDEDVTQFILHSDSTIKLSFNCVRQTDVSKPLSDMVYLSKLASIHDVTKNGLLIRGACEGGVSLSLISGLLQPTALASGAHVGSPFIGVCLSTGPVKAGALAVTGVMEQSDSLIWSSSESNHALLGRSNYRIRDSPEWKDWEDKCGIKGREMRLMPIKVAVVEPRRRAVTHIESIYNTTV